MAIACQNDTSWEANRELVETTCKDGGGYRMYRPGLRGASTNVTGYVQTPAGTADPKAMATAMMAGTLLEVTTSSSEVGVPGISGEAYCENFSVTGSGVEQMVEFSATLRFHGTFAIA